VFFLVVETYDGGTRREPPLDAARNRSARRGATMETREITAEEATKLLDGTTPGPWRTRQGHTYEVGPTVIVESAPVDIDVALVIETGNPVDANDARLIAAAPELARTVITQSAEVERLRAVVAGDPTRRMIRTEDVARALWPFVYAGRRDACDDEGFGPRFDDLAQTAQDLFCALIDEAMQTMGAAIKRDPAEEDRRAVAAAWMFDAFAARGKRITELAAELAEARAALRYYGPRCVVCDRMAPRSVLSTPACDVVKHMSDARSPAAIRHNVAVAEVEHANALRAAEGER
jgi:hypothetical protein